MKLTYWVAKVIGDSPSYNIRARTKKAALAVVAQNNAEDYEPVFKVVVEYASAFDLIDEALSEVGIEWDYIGYLKRKASDSPKILPRYRGADGTK